MGRYSEEMQRPPPQSLSLPLFLITVGLLFAQCSTTGARLAPNRGGSAHSAPGPRVVAIAKRYIGTRYRYGGRTPATGFDCSGYTRYVMARAGRRIPGGAKNQFLRMRRVRAPRPGDLVFFRTIRNRVSHVGIYVGNYRFLHAPRTGKRIGYADIRNRYWRKRYAGARSAF